MSDGELLKAIASGVGKDGKALLLMPCQSFDNLSHEDVASIMDYMRTLQTIENQIAETSLDFPLNLLVRTIPAPHQSHPEPDTPNLLAYGKYPTNAGTCIECHTQHDKGEMIPVIAFAGGVEFEMPGETLRSANITPDEVTGIGA